QEAGSADTVSGVQAQNIPVQNNLMDQSVLRRLEPFEQRVKGTIAVPRLDAVVRVERAPAASRIGDAVSAGGVGTDLGAMTRLNPAWRREGTPNSAEGGMCVAGTNLAARLGVGIGDTVKIEPLAMQSGEQQRNRPPSVFTVSDILSTGSAEDD